MVLVGTQSTAARSIGVAWGRFREQPGVAGDKYLSKMDSGGSSGVTSGASGGPFWREISWIKYMPGGIFVDCSS